MYFKHCCCAYMTRHHVCILNSADWFVGVFVLLEFDCTYTTFIMADGARDW